MHDKAVSEGSGATPSYAFWRETKLCRRMCQQRGCKMRCQNQFRGEPLERDTGATRDKRESHTGEEMRWDSIDSPDTGHVDHTDIQSSARPSASCKSAVSTLRRVLRSRPSLQYFASTNRARSTEEIPPRTGRHTGERFRRIFHHQIQDCETREVWISARHFFCFFAYVLTRPACYQEKLTKQDGEAPTEKTNSCTY